MNRSNQVSIAIITSLTTIIVAAIALIPQCTAMISTEKALKNNDKKQKIAEYRKYKKRRLNYKNTVYENEKMR